MLRRLLAIAALTSLGSVYALPTASTTTAQCSNKQKIEAVRRETKTITSHSVADAAAIPLAPLASRTFVVVPTELYGLAAPVNVGLTADTVRAELVALATVLDAEVKPGSDHYTVNANGTATVDYIQLDHIGVLPAVSVREIHTFDDKCQIVSILGYVHGDLTNFL